MWPAGVIAGAVIVGLSVAAGAGLPLGATEIVGMLLVAALVNVVGRIIGSPLGRTCGLAAFSSPHGVEDYAYARVNHEADR